jgi:hypothetical protein
MVKDGVSLMMLDLYVYRRASIALEGHGRHACCAMIFLQVVALALPERDRSNHEPPGLASVVMRRVSPPDGPTSGQHRRH